MAAGGRFCAAWQSGEGTARGVEGGGELQRDAWMPAQAGGGRRGGPERRAALPSGSGREAEQAGTLEEGENGLKHNFKNSRDLTVNQQ